MDEGRRRHYGTFYGLNPLPEDGRPILLVHGNCQAEALRVILAGPGQTTDGSADGGRVAPVRIPPVHELEATDLPFLTALLGRTGVLLSQPVRDGYRDLPLGTAQLAALLPPGARVLRFPIVRYLGLHPYQAIIRHPSDPAAVPDGVPYHDLRILAAARDGLPLPQAVAQARRVDADAPTLRQVGEDSLAELARRETRCDVAVSDVVAGLGVGAVHTINHPGNELLLALAHRIQEALGGPGDAADPGRTLLGGVHAPRQPEVLAALGLPGTGEQDWVVAGQAIALTDIVEAQLAWYAVHPQFIEAGSARHAERIAQLHL